MRRARQEFFSILATLALPLAVVASFPYGAIGFKAEQPPAVERPFAAFVTLTEEEESRATVAVKASWQSGVVAFRRIRADLSVGELPEESHGTVLELSTEALRMPEREIPVDIPPFPPTMAAPSPEKILPVPAEDGEPFRGFSREELLKID